MAEPIFNFRESDKAQALGYMKNGINTFVCGPNGTGKTLMAKSILEEVSDKMGQAVYVDCMLYQTTNAVLREILLSIGSVIASKSNYELTKRLREKTRKFKLYLFLDHFDGLKSSDTLGILMGLDFCLCVIADSFQSYRAINLPQTRRRT
jgi:Cdc6-like AAA superfamily ATPase